MIDFVFTDSLLGTWTEGDNHCIEGWKIVDWFWIPELQNEKKSYLRKVGPQWKIPLIFLIICIAELQT